MAKRRVGAITRIPDVRTITIGCFTLTAIGMDVRGRPSFEEYQGVGEFINRAHRASAFWLGDWLRYGDEREDWRERLSQAQDITGLSQKTLKNIRAVAGSVDPSRRRDDVEFYAHAEIAGLQPQDQSYWLEQAKMNGWGLRELRLAIRASRRRRVLEGQAILQGQYRVLYADPAWQYGNRPPSGSGAVEHYPTMSIEELCALPVAAHALPDSVLFLWCTAPLLLQNPGPRDVGDAWGFIYKQNRVWDKVLGTFSHYTGGNHEHLTIWTRGSCLPDVPTDLPDSVEVIRKGDEHSAKPEDFRRAIEKHWTRGPYLELFGTRLVEGWTVFGNDARLWGDDAARSHLAQGGNNGGTAHRRATMEETGPEAGVQTGPE